MTKSAQDDPRRRFAPLGAESESTEPGNDPGNPFEAGAPRTLPDAVERLSQLSEELAAARAEIEQARDRSLRERADLENFKRRMQRDKSDALRYANEPLLRDLLPVIDNLERAVRAARGAETGGHGRAPTGALAGLVSGVEMVLHQFAEVLERHGVTRLGAAGQSFDPAEHEAIAHVETGEHPPGNVVDEHQSGYRLHDRLLRAAQVSVAKAPAGVPSARPGNGDVG